MPDSRPGRREFPEFSVTEDSPRRLVLATGASRQIIAAILFVLGLAAGAGGWLGGDEPLFLLVPAVLLVAGGTFFLLDRQRWTFDATRGTVAFDSLLRGAWEAKMGSVAALKITSRSHGPVGEELDVHLLMMTVEGRRKPLRLNTSGDLGLILEQKRRIEAMIEPWRRSGSSSGMLS